MQVSRRSRSSSSRASARASRGIAGHEAELLALGALGIVVIGAPQLFGGVFAWSVPIIAAAAVVALIITLRAVRKSPSRRTPWVVFAVCGAAVWTCIQALPLPCGAVSLIAPDAVSELRAVLSLAGAPAPGWCTLSRDVGATRLEVLKGVAIVSAFLSAWWLSAHGARSRVIWLVGCSSLLMSIVAHLHMALGLTQVFGVYRPVYAGHGLQLAPLMNPNNLGGFAALGVPIWLAILRRDRELRMRVLAGLAVVLCATTALLSLSRGAIAILFGNAALFMLLQRRRGGQSSDSRAARWGTLAVGAALAAGIGLGAYLATDQVLSEFRAGGVDKLALIAGSLRFATHHPWLGVGRGAFASTYVAHGDSALFLYSENFFTQWASDWGLPVAIALVVVFAHAVWRALRDDEAKRRLGAIVGIVGLAVQNLFDLSFELAGVAVVAAALLGAAVAPSRRLKRADPARGVPALPFALGALCAAVIALASLGRSVMQDSTEQWDEALRARIEAHDHRGFMTILQRAVRLHPVEPRFALLAASEALPNHDRNTPRWINRAMRLAPGWTAPHLQAFLWLWQAGHRDQALLEMRAAAEISAAATAQYACMAAQTGSSPVLQAAPRKSSKQRADFIELASSCMGIDHPVSRELDRVLLGEFPKSAAAREREAVRLARQDQLDAAMRELDTVLRENPGRAITSTLKVQLLSEGKRYAEAARAAADLARSLPPQDTAQLWRVRAGALAALGDDAGWMDAVAALRRVTSNDTKQLADSFAFEGQLHQQRGQPGEALRSYRAAYRINQDSKYLQTYADISTQLGDRASALWAYMELCQREPGNAASCAKRDALLEQARAMNFGGKLRN